MKYSRYKKSYSDCETIHGTYDKETKTIGVVIPDGRMKNSGVRGQSYSICGSMVLKIAPEGKLEFALRQLVYIMQRKGFQRIALGIFNIKA